ncbi:MAG TPA: haloacid dehalogenase-like hydrolase [Candidatus Sulfotelmatobacter sp.]|nr:haloacid dehalogenase-like hydrolase [Candidatus Sulfotelmatobacter sp.]
MNTKSSSQAHIAAFFDLDGTLLPEPSLEHRFFANLRRNHKISVTNYLRWTAQSLRLLPQGLLAIHHGNKRYLTDIPCDLVFRYMDSISFFEEGVARIAWHVRQAHKIILVSGTLEPLAHLAATALACELETRGLELRPLLCATRLKEHRGRWIGGLDGPAMYGPAKAHAVEALAKRHRLDLHQCHAYANSLLDRYFLFTVGHPHAVNPSRELVAIANQENWPIWSWCQAQTTNPQRNARLSSRIESLEKQA